MKRVLCCLLFGLLSGVVMAKDFPITSYGAKPGVKYLNTVAINKAIDACFKNGGGRVVIPAGVFRSGTLLMKNTFRVED